MVSIPGTSFPNVGVNKANMHPVDRSRMDWWKVEENYRIIVRHMEWPEPLAFISLTLTQQPSLFPGLLSAEVLSKDQSFCSPSNYVLLVISVLTPSVQLGNSYP